SRVPWHLVDKVTWRGGTLTVTPAVDAGDGVLDEQPSRPVRLDRPRDLPPTVRARVERTIAYTRHYPLRPAGGVRVVGRRVPGQVTRQRRPPQYARGAGAAGTGGARSPMVRGRCRSARRYAWWSKSSPARTAPSSRASRAPRARAAG